MTEFSKIQAVLGPTNTGKTHQAIERMLEFNTGMIGLPLRLLAREVYDRISLRVGESRVALITGEEKRVPHRPDYWVCTVEAMPVSQSVEFMAIDEIQLVSHPQRGHVFTDRLLNARGAKETWFMGASTVANLVEELVPTAQHSWHPRWSKLAYTGAVELTRVPARSAIIAFSMQQVYELAEKIRELKGGAAVVLGALSPRTRNAQVAMFQAGEVDHLVATDAIGMGLNLDLRHVAFSSVRKYDGSQLRGLDTAELAQIAGRAGRYTVNGTFGCVTPTGLSPEVADDIVHHRLPHVKRAWWRNSQIDTSSLEALKWSLRAPPSHPSLQRVPQAIDEDVLDLLLMRDDIRKWTRDKTLVPLLWEICSIPDFKQVDSDAHALLLGELFSELARRGRLDSDWLNVHISPLEDTIGDVDALLYKIASIRTWTYVSHQAQWVDKASHWQEKTRAIEDRLSDSLHESLMRQFVDKSAGRRTSASGKKKSDKKADSLDLRSPFAALLKLKEQVRVDDRWTRSRDSSHAWAEELVDAPITEFSLGEKSTIVYDGRTIAELSKGPSITQPHIRLVGAEGLPAGLRSQLERRMTAAARDVAAGLFAEFSLNANEPFAGAWKGVRYMLEQGLGLVAIKPWSNSFGALNDASLQDLEQAGIEVGRLCVAWPNVFKPIHQRARESLARVYYPELAAIKGDQLTRRWFSPPSNVPSAALHPLGYVLCGVAIEYKIAEVITQIAIETPISAARKKIRRVLRCPPEVVARFFTALDETLRSDPLPHRP